MAQTTKSEIEETISEKLKRLVEIKLQLMKAINQIGGSCGPTDSFDSYPDKIIDAKGSFNLSDITITQNNVTLYATNEEVLGWKKITVNVPESSGSGSGDGSSSSSGSPGSSGSGSGGSGSFGDVDVVKYEVVFKNPYDPSWSDEDNTVEVEEGQYATAPTDGIYYKLGTDEENKQYKFKGWKPDVTTYKIQEPGVVFEAVFKTKNAEIEDNWDVIVKNAGSYDLGDWKYLTFGGVNYYSNVLIDSDMQPSSVKYAQAGRMKMHKVHGSGYAGNSVWMSEGIEGKEANSSSYYALTLPFLLTQSRVNTSSFAKNSIVDWSKSYVRNWLNSTLLNAIKEVVASNVKSCNNKYTVNGSRGADVTSVSDKLWIPAYSQIITSFTDDEGYDLFDGNFVVNETKGYWTGMYTEVPTSLDRLGYVMTRSAVVGSQSKVMGYSVRYHGALGGINRISGGGEYDNWNSRPVNVCFCL